MRPQGEPVVRSESSSGRRGRIVSKSSETTRLLCALGSWAPRLQPHEWDMHGGRYRNECDPGKTKETVVARVRIVKST